MTRVIICRKSDRKVRTIYADESVDTVREKYIKAALGNRRFNAGKWSIDLDENLVLSIDQALRWITKDLSVRNPNPFGPKKVVKRVFGRKHPSSAGH